MNNQSNLDEIIKDIYYLEKEIVNCDKSIENINKIYELLIYTKSLKITLDEIYKYTQQIIKSYYTENNNLSLNQVNKTIHIEEQMNLDFIKNKNNNFSCRYIVNNSEEKFVLTKSIYKMIQILKDELKIYKTLNIKDFRSKENKDQYIKVINTFIMLSKLDKYNITLK